MKKYILFSLAMFLLFSCGIQKENRENQEAKNQAVKVIDKSGKETILTGIKIVNPGFWREPIKDAKLNLLPNKYYIGGDNGNLLYPYFIEDEEIGYLKDSNSGIIELKRYKENVEEFISKDYSQFSYLSKLDFDKVKLFIANDIYVIVEISELEKFKFYIKSRGLYSDRVYLNKLPPN